MKSKATKRKKFTTDLNSSKFDFCIQKNSALIFTIHMQPYSTPFALKIQLLRNPTYATHSSPFPLKIQPLSPLLTTWILQVKSYTGEDDCAQAWCSMKDEGDEEPPSWTDCALQEMLWCILKNVDDQDVSDCSSSMEMWCWYGAGVKAWFSNWRTYQSCGCVMRDREEDSDGGESISCYCAEMSSKIWWKDARRN